MFIEIRKGEEKDYEMKKKVIVGLLTGCVVVISGCGRESQTTMTEQAVVQEKMTTESREKKEFYQMPTEDELGGILSNMDGWAKQILKLKTDIKYEELDADMAVSMCVYALINDEEISLESNSDAEWIISKEDLEIREMEMFGRVFDLNECSNLENFQIRSKEDGSVCCQVQGEVLDTLEMHIEDIETYKKIDNSSKVTVIYTFMDENGSYSQDALRMEYIVVPNEASDFNYNIIEASGKNAHGKFYSSIQELPTEFKENLKQTAIQEVKEYIGTFSQMSDGIINDVDTTYIGSYFLNGSPEGEVQNGLMMLVKETVGHDLTLDEEGNEETFIYYYGVWFPNLGENISGRATGGTTTDWTRKIVMYMYSNPYSEDFGWYTYKGFDSFQHWSDEVESYAGENGFTLADTDITEPPTEVTGPEDRVDIGEE